MISMQEQNQDWLERIVMGTFTDKNQCVKPMYVQWNFYLRKYVTGVIQKRHVLFGHTVGEQGHRVHLVPSQSLIFIFLCHSTHGAIVCGLKT